MDARIALLRASAALGAYSPGDLRRLARLSELVDAAPDQVLVRRGTRHAGCFLLLDGALVSRTDGDWWLTTKAGTFVGLAETLAHRPAEADTFAVRQSTLLSLTAPALTGALDAIPPMRHAVLAQLAQESLLRRSAVVTPPPATVAPAGQLLPEPG